MPDMGDYLRPRMALIGHAFRAADEKYLWRWRDYDWHAVLDVGEFHGDGSLIRFHQPNNWEGAIEIRNLTPIGVLDRKVVEIPTGPEKIIDQLTANGYNYDGVVEVPLRYEGEFRKLRSSSEAFSYGLTQSIQLALKFSQGNETSFVKFEQQLTVGFESRQDWSRGSAEEEESRRLAGISPEAPPGYDLRFILVRKSQPKKLKVSGVAQMDHSVQIGKFKYSKDYKGFTGHRGKGGKTYSRWAKYDSFFEELLPVLKGEGRRDLQYAEHFKENPLESWLLRRLEEPLEVPFEHTSAEFDGGTTLDQHQEVLRGPKT